MSPLSTQAKAQAEHDIRQYLTAIGKKYISISLKQLKLFCNDQRDIKGSAALDDSTVYPAISHEY